MMTMHTGLNKRAVLLTAIVSLVVMTAGIGSASAYSIVSWGADKKEGGENDDGDICSWK